MKIKHLLVALVLLVSLAASEYVTPASSWAAGVSKGDCFYYETYGVYTSNISNLTINIPKFEYNTTAWVRITIADVSGSVVYQVYTLRFKNGSESTFSFKTDLNPQNESSLEFTQKGIPMCAANLKVGDSLPTVQLTINKTVMWTYLSASRETNVVTWNFSDDWGNCYFDKETGILIELCRVHEFINNATGEIVQKADVVKLVSTNRWAVTHNQTPTP